MKETFRGYYRPSEDEFKSLWENCLFIPDANVLLNLYRYSKETTDDWLKVFRQIADRLWMPHQAALEFQENRLGVIAEQVERYNEVSKVVEEVRKNLQTGLDDLQLRKRHSAIDPDELLGKVDDLFGTFQRRLEELEQRQPKVHEEDTIRNQIDSLFEGKVGPPPQSQDYLERLYEEGDLRYQIKRPPGYMDKAKKKDGARAYSYGELVIRTEYGDLILWKQILEE